MMVILGLKTELLTIESEGIGDLEVEKGQIRLFIGETCTLLYLIFLRNAVSHVKSFEY